MHFSKKSTCLTIICLFLCPAVKHTAASHEGEATEPVSEEIETLFSLLSRNLILARETFPKERGFWTTAAHHLRNNRQKSLKRASDESFVAVTINGRPTNGRNTDGLAAAGELLAAVTGLVTKLNDDKRRLRENERDRVASVKLLEQLWDKRDRLVQAVEEKRRMEKIMEQDMAERSKKLEERLKRIAEKTEELDERERRLEERREALTKQFREELGQEIREQIEREEKEQKEGQKDLQQQKQQTDKEKQLQTRQRSEYSKIHNELQRLIMKERQEIPSVWVSDIILNALADTELSKRNELKLALKELRDLKEKPKTSGGASHALFSRVVARLLKITQAFHVKVMRKGESQVKSLIVNKLTNITKKNTQKLKARMKLSRRI